MAIRGLGSAWPAVVFSPVVGWALSGLAVVAVFTMSAPRPAVGGVVSPCLVSSVMAGGSAMAAMAAAATSLLPQASVVFIRAVCAACTIWLRSSAGSMVGGSSV